MRRRHAFTLIELLVVIAIIAILAAILFPVFAQAKLAAKKAASLSNIKQIAMASLMYGNDYDDTFPLFMNGTYANARGGNAPDHTTDTWVWIIQPYIKSLQLMVDPGRGDSRGYFGGGTLAWWGNQNVFPMYGLNYIFMSPFLVDGSGACNYAEGRSGTQATDPAQTVFFVNSRVFSEGTTRGFFGANAPGMWEWIAPHPTYCIFWDETPCGGDWCGSPNSSVKSTASTSMNYQNGTTVSWVDGHAKYMTDRALAAGTTYSTAVPGGPDGGGGAKIVDKDRYLWNLDDNYFGG
jgi:prepilin-type N-terminal cleavage/methylation domain-containing protein/prepilin-type processing-associated H-X9-DG protein